MVLKALINLLGVSILGCHAWSMRCHFDIDLQRMPKGMNMLSMLALVSMIVMGALVFFGRQPIAAQLLALFLMTASLLLFWATIRTSRNAGLLAAFDENPPACLLQNGPYAVVRHPFYTSYLLLWSGWALATWHVLALLPLAALSFAYWTAARREERKFASTPMAADYAAYASATGRFFPRIFTGTGKKSGANRSVGRKNG